MREEVRPLLILVTGAPASGKTTLAGHLSREFRLPLLSRAALKEALMDSLGSPDRARSRELGAASYRLLTVVLERLLDAGVGAVVESNFRRGLAERDLAGAVAHCRCVQVHCWTTPLEVRRRFAERAESGGRHHGHHDTSVDTLADLEASLASGRHGPLNLPVPLLRVETTAGYLPDLPALQAFIASA